MLIQIDAERAHTFAEPLGLLSDCHRRIERFLEQLLRVTQAGAGGPLEPEARAAFETALRYFRQAAPWHTADEEVSLFPRLRERAGHGDEKARRAVSLLDRLEADHDAADLRHALVDELGNRWLDKGTLTAPEVARLETELLKLRELYAVHIGVEDRELFPLAGEVLDAAAVEAVGREMAERRGVDYDAPDAMQRCSKRHD